MSKTYTVKKGDSLNSIAQQHGFKNFREAGISSVPSGNFDRINPGEVITFGTPTNSVQQTTTAQRGITSKNKADFEETTARLASGLTASQEKALADSEFDRSQESLVELEETKKSGERATGLFDEQGRETDLESSIKNANQSAKEQIKKIESDLGRIGNLLSSSTSSAINAITSSYGARIKKMELANQNLFKLKQTTGIRQGTARFAQGVQAGVLTDEEIAGHERIASLEGEMYSLIAQAEQAKADGKLKLFNARYDSLQKVYDNLNKEIKDSYDRALEVDKAFNAAVKAESDAAKAEFEFSLDKSAAAAPFIANQISQLATAEEKESFIESYAKTQGLEGFSDVLYGEIEKYVDEQTKLDLDIRSKTASLVGTQLRNVKLQQEVEETDTDTVSLGELSTTDKKEISQVGLSNAGVETQSFYLNLPKTTRDDIARGVAAGLIDPLLLTIAEMQKVLDDEEEDEDPFADIN